MVQGQCLGLTKLKLILCLFIIQFQGQNVSSPNAAVEDDPQLGTTAADDGLTYTVVIFSFASSVTTEAEDIPYFSEWAVYNQILLAEVKSRRGNIL